MRNIPIKSATSFAASVALFLAIAGAVVPASGALAQPPDYTARLSLKPGMRVTYQVHDGLDTRWKRLGDYQFSADVERRAMDYAYSFKWSMTAPVQASGIRSVASEDCQSSHKVSLFYPDGQNCCLIGYTNILRISNDLYRRLKRREKTDFELDGPEVLLIYHRENVPLPHTIEAISEETVDVTVNGKPARVQAIKTETSNGWHYWIMDNANFPIIVKSDGPFRWDPPDFSLSGSFDDQAARNEGKRVVDDLRLHGVATTHAILFDFDSDKLKPQSRPILNQVGEYLRGNRTINLAVEGHCDNIGGYQYNISLSMRRARSVRTYLIQKCGIAATRLKAQGFGFTKPIADNASASGRALNRRVVFKQY